jgi:glycine oxidase
LARAGHRVTVADPAPVGEGASGVAAGMLAPAFESLFDETAEGRFGLLAAARELWPPLARSIGLPLARDGALAVGDQDQVETWAAKLGASGARRQGLGPAEARQLAPGLAPGAWAVFSPEDWRLDAGEALRRLRAAAEALGVWFLADRLVGFAAGRADFEGAPPIAADAVVLATGAAPSGLAPELAHLAPIKGHILRTPWSGAAGPTIRAADVYVCRQTGSLILGASMEAGRGDSDIDPAVVRSLLARAERIVPGVEQREWSAATGVRAATPDGLPLVGPSSTPGVIVAAGARRNGWLLAPLIAETVLQIVEGAPPSAAAALFDPARLEPIAPG